MGSVGDTDFSFLPHKSSDDYTPSPQVEKWDREYSQQPAIHIFTQNYRAPGLPWWLSGKEPACQCRRSRFDPWAGKIPWRRKWQPTPVFLPGKSHGQRSLVGCSPWGHKRVGHNLATKQQQQDPCHRMCQAWPTPSHPSSLCPNPPLPSQPHCLQLQ